MRTGLWFAGLVFGLISVAIMGSSLMPALMILIFPGLAVLFFTKIFLVQLLLTPAFLVWGRSPIRRISSFALLGLVPLVMYGYPQFAQHAALREISRQKAGDIASPPSRKHRIVKLSGNFEHQSRDTAQCGSLCLRLLFNGAVEKIYIGDKSFQIATGTACAPVVEEVSMVDRSKSENGITTTAYLRSAINSRIAIGECLIENTAVVDDYTLEIRRSGLPASAGRTIIGGGAYAEVYQFERHQFIERQDRVERLILQKTEASWYEIDAPLAIARLPGMWGFARRLHPSPPMHVEDALESVLGFDAGAVRAPTIARIAERLTEILDSTGDRQSKELAALFEQAVVQLATPVSGSPDAPSENTIAVLLRAIEDQRVEFNPNSQVVYKAFRLSPTAAKDFAQASLRRLAKEENTRNNLSATALMFALGSAPMDALQGLGPELLSAWSKFATHSRSEFLLPALRAAGARGVEIYVSLLGGSSWSTPDNLRAAYRSLCYLGSPDANPAIPILVKSLLTKRSSTSNPELNYPALKILVRLGQVELVRETLAAGGIDTAVVSVWHDMYQGMTLENFCN